MRSGVLYPRPTWEPPIFASEFSFWPSTRAEDGESCGNHPNGASDSLTGVTRNWATPTASLMNDGEDPESWMARTEKLKALGINGNGAGTPLTQQSQMWQTPASD